MSSKIHLGMQNEPNVVPLCTLLAFYNEALITTFAGYHPDAYWDKADILKKNTDKKVDNDGPLLIPDCQLIIYWMGKRRRRLLRVWLQLPTIGRDQARRYLNLWMVSTR